MSPHLNAFRNFESGCPAGTNENGPRFATILLVAIVLTGCQHGPPHERGVFREPDLVELVERDPSIRLDIRYASSNNFLHRPVYAQARAFLQRPAAEALV